MPRLKADSETFEHHGLEKLNPGVVLGMWVNVECVADQLVGFLALRIFAIAASDRKVRSSLPNPLLAT